MKRVLSLGLLSLLVACGSSWTQAPSADIPYEEGPVKVPTAPAEPPEFTLSTAPKALPTATNGVPQPNAAPMATTPLSEKEVKDLLSRVGAAPKEEPVSFSLREGSLPPPKVGSVVLGEFPPKESLTKPNIAAETKPLEVIRYEPTGPVDPNAEITVSFSRPMVALTTLTALSQEESPVKIAPIPEGKWRWVGTKILQFTPTKPMQMATKFTVNIPAGTKSANNEALAKEVSFSFSTSSARITGSYPTGESVVPGGLIFFQFNQVVDPSKIAAVTHGKVGHKELALRLSTPEEIAKDKIVRKLYANVPAGTAVAFTPEQEIPLSTKVKVKVGPKIPSAEGPLTEEGGQFLEYSTYSPLKLDRVYCGYSGNCDSYSDFDFSFNNQLDPSSIDTSKILIEPKLPKASITVYGSYVEISGTKPAGRYWVTIPAGVRDVFGQTIDREISMEFRVVNQRERRYRYEELSASAGGFAIMTPESSKRFPVRTQDVGSFRLTAYKVKPEDWLSKAYYDYVYDEKKNKPIGEKVFSEVFRVKDARKGETAVTYVDLSTALPDGVGQLVIEVEERGLLDVFKQRSASWLQVTRLGVDAFYDSKGLYAWANSLDDGSSKEDTELQLLEYKREYYPIYKNELIKKQDAKTDATGVATFTPPGTEASDSLLIAKKGNDALFLTELRHVSAPQDRLLWFVTDGRRLYRPGEEVKIKGWVRYQGGEAGAPVKAVEGTALQKLSVLVSDQRGNELNKQTISLDENGGFSISFTLPKTVNLGAVNVNFTSGAEGLFASASHNLALEVQEYRRPEFEVKAEIDPGPYFFGDTLITRTMATYFAGGGLAKAKLGWSVKASDTNFTPPNQSEYAFGQGDHWSERRGKDFSSSFTAETDEAGEHELQIAFSKDAGFYPRSLSGTVSVYDVNRQAFSGSFSTIVHPSSAYVGLKTEKPFSKTKEPLVVEAIASNIDGELIAGRPITITMGRYGWSEDDAKYTLLDVQTCEKTSGKEKVTCTFNPKKEGLYQINASIKDEKGRENRSQLYRYVASETGGSELIEDKAQLLANKTSYAPGETAELLLIAPFFPAEGMLRVKHGAVVKAERFSVKGSTALLPVKIGPEMYPSMRIEIELVGSATVEREKIPAFASASVELSIPPVDRKLTVEVTPKASELMPGSDTSLDIVLKDQSGKPIQGEATVFIMDESLLALSGFTMPDPMESFYTAQYADFAAYRTRDRLYLPKKREFSKDALPVEGADVMVTGASFGFTSDEEDVKELEIVQRSAPAPMKKAKEALGGFAKREKSAAPRQDGAYLEAPSGGSYAPPAPPQDTSGISLRSTFESLAFFQDRVKIDATGKATINYKLQDSLTRYRIMVVAASGVQKLGTGESNITARLPLMVRPSPPRFLLQGDQAEVSVVLQNQTKDAMKLSVALRGTLTSLAEGKGYKIEIPANDRREIRFPLKALSAGTTTLQVAASAPGVNDAAEVKLPIYTPATTEAFAMYGEIDDGAISQPIKVGDDVNVDFGGVDVAVTSTALASLTDAVLYLTKYPYECAEQKASRMLGILALKDFLFEFKAEGLPTKEQLNKIIEQDIADIEKLQHSSGGFGFFSKDERPWPYTSLHVTHALIRAKLAGYKVNESVLNQAKSYIDYIRRARLFTGRYSDSEKDAIDAYTVYVLRLFGDKDSLSESRLEDKLDKLSFEALGWIMPSLSKEKQAIVYKRLLAVVTETAGGAHFETTYDNGAYYLLGSARRTDAILLEALIDSDPKNELIPKLVKGLMMARVQGRWATTQENVFTLLALKKYFETYEKATPDFVARVWLGDGYAGDHAFKGRTTETYSLRIPMKDVVAKKSTSLFVSKEGAGRLYYRLGLSYAPKDINLPALESGFTVARTYEAVDDASDVTKNKDGSWTVKAGAKVKVKVSMIAPSLRYHVALVDPMPAGFEAENPTLSPTTSASDSDPDEWQYYGRNFVWYQHQNLRDERAEAFTTYLFEGAYSYEYYARATTPGIFIAPPAKAEEMYAPETFGRSASDKVIVEE